MKRSAIDLLFAILLSFGLRWTADAAYSYSFWESGAKLLFIGNSFFIRPAENINEFADVDGSWAPNHDYSQVFRGGGNGAPGALWRTNQAEVEALLAAGDVEVFALTAYPRDSDLIDYTRWIDMALSYNQDTSIFIAAPYVSFGPDPRFDAYSFNASTALFGDIVYNDIIVPLRQTYVNTQILYMNFGETTSAMYTLFEQGELESVVNLVSEDRTNSLFRDLSPGHGANYVEEMIGIVFLCFLYNANPQDLNLPPNNYEIDDIVNVVNGVLDYNMAYDPQSTLPLPVPDVDAIPEPFDTCLFELSCGITNGGGGGGGCQWWNILCWLRRLLRLF